MINCPSHLRNRAIEVLRKKTEIDSDEIHLKKLFYYMDCYCVELKMTEEDILLNDERWDSFYYLFNSIMVERVSSKVF